MPDVRVMLPVEEPVSELSCVARLAQQMSGLFLFPFDTDGYLDSGLSPEWFCIECGCVTLIGVDDPRVFLFSHKVQGEDDAGEFAGCAQRAGERPICGCHILPSFVSKGAGSVLWRAQSRPSVGEPAAGDCLLSSTECLSCGDSPVLFWFGSRYWGGPLAGWYCAPCAEVDPSNGWEASRVLLEHRVALGCPPGAMRFF